jgi:hypothetical protein
LLFSNEIEKELVMLPEIKFEKAAELTPEKITPEIVKSALEYIESIRRYYIRKYNVANSQRDNLVTKLESENNTVFRELKNNYFNLSLEESVTAENDTQKTIDYNGELVQKLDPIYMDPEGKFIKAHFYSPTKQVFGWYADTYIINVLVIMCMTLFLYLVLYFRILKKLLSSGERLIGKKTKGTDRELI